MKELICIVCPNGCHLQVDEENDYAVTGNACPRGAEYGQAELTHPTRVVTSTVRVVGSDHPRCAVKTDRAIPKEKVFACVAALEDICLTAPVKIGDVVLEDVCGTGARILATQNRQEEKNG